MNKVFNITGSCNPDKHYMVNLDSRLMEIKKYIDDGKYFTINRSRQYGKTTTLIALSKYIEKDYIVLNIDFQFFSHEDFADEGSFVSAFSQELLMKINNRFGINDQLYRQLENMTVYSKKLKLGMQFRWFSMWCKLASKPIVLIIDEVDSASNNQVFLDFLAQLRGYYLARDERSTFWSVIFAGVHDISIYVKKSDLIQNTGIIVHGILQLNSMLT